MTSGSIPLNPLAPGLFLESEHCKCKFVKTTMQEIGYLRFIFNCLQCRVNDMGHS
jgi:hypothetical protein